MFFLEGTHDKFELWFKLLNEIKEAAQEMSKKGHATLGGYTHKKEIPIEKIRSKVKKHSPRFSHGPSPQYCFLIPMSEVVFIW